MKVFILEDDKSWQFVYQETLGIRFDIQVLSNIDDLEKALVGQTSPYVLLADLKLDDRSFLTYLREHPKLTDLAKILVISSTDDVAILEECYALGVSDYLTKPINTQELVVKTKRLRDLAINKGSLGLRIDRMSNRISFNEKEIQLTPREFQILNFLIDRGESGVQKGDLLQSIWKNTNVTSNTVEVHICNIRKKLDPIGFEITTKAPHTFYLAPRKAELDLEG
jgi:DNA-binding response OmpR family regulator